MKKTFFIIALSVFLAMQFYIMAECQIGAFIPSTISGQLFSVSDINSYADLIGRKPALVSTFISFAKDFPAADCDRAYQAGCVPMLNWFPQTGKGTNTLQDIIDGGQDTYLRHFALQVKAFDRNIMIRLGQEMNLAGFDWSGNTNGGAKTNYGNPKLFDGPERYVNMFRHVRTVFDQAGADNVRWIWCPNSDSVPALPWNSATNYYPGDSYIDWIGIDGYNFGNPWRSFDATYSNIYTSLTAITRKPVMIGEFACSSIDISGTTTNKADSMKASWITDAFSKIKNRYTAIRAFFWFNEDKTGVNEWERDWRVDSGSLSLAAFRQAMDDPYFWSYGSADVYGPTLTGIYQENLEIRIGPNYFKPAETPVLNIFYRVKNKSTLSIRIFDSNGKEVRTLLDGQTITGGDSPSYASWDGKDSSGAGVKSGFYLADILEGKSNHKVERIILVR